MNRSVIRNIDNMRIQGIPPTVISRSLGVSVNTVKSHIRRHPEIPGTLRCLSCGKSVMQTEGRKAKKYCSDRCRTAYWNEQRRKEKANE
jgi:predicted nucleic acid-binding Zn ribbon protein